MSDTAYISRNISLCPAEAATVADEWHGRLVETAKSSRFIRCANRLWLSTEMGGVDSDHLVVRHASGILWVGTRPVSVEFEMSVWSTTATTLAIRPRSQSSVIFSERYATTAHRALEYVVQSFMITRECRSARADAYRSVRETLLERNFEWPPARTVPQPTPFPRPSQVEEESPRVAAGNR
jgi:hypothetical protein